MNLDVRNKVKRMLRKVSGEQNEENEMGAEKLGDACENDSVVEQRTAM